MSRGRASEREQRVRATPGWVAIVAVLTACSFPSYTYRGGDGASDGADAAGDLVDAKDDAPEAPMCLFREAICVGACIDLQVNDQNCGACASDAARTSTAQGGACVCASGLSDCPTACFIRYRSLIVRRLP